MQEQKQEHTINHSIVLMQLADLKTIPKAEAKVPPHLVNRKQNRDGNIHSSGRDSSLRCSALALRSGEVTLPLNSTTIPS